MAVAAEAEMQVGRYWEDRMGCPHCKGSET